MAPDDLKHMQSVLKAVEEWHAGTLDELEAYRLKELLRNSPQARQVFIEYGDMLAMLDLHAEAESSERGDLLAARTLENESRHHRRRMLQGVTILTVVTCLVIGAGILLTQHRPLPVLAIRPADSNSPGLPLATVSASFSNAAPQLPPDPESELFLSSVAAGRTFFTGEQIVISAADLFVELKFSSGALLLVQGPATLEFTDERSARLLSGRVLGKVPSQASGFTVFVPHGLVRDLGTEFAITVTGNTADVAVLSGSVECELPETVESTTPRLQVSAGENAKIDESELISIPGSTPHRLLETLLGYRAGIVRFDGQVEFQSGQSPLPGEKRGQLNSRERILVFPERTRIPFAWRKQSRKFQELPTGDEIPASDVPRVLVTPNHFSTVPLLEQDQDEIHIDSYLMEFAPVGSERRILVGSVTFQREILGVITRTEGLLRSDTLSTVPGFVQAWKMASPIARGSSEGGDKVMISEDARTLTVMLQASGAGDQLRIFVRSANPPQSD